MSISKIYDYKEMVSYLKEKANSTGKCIITSEQGKYGLKDVYDKYVRGDKLKQRKGVINSILEKVDK